jgi:hypothetical protein
VKLRVWIEDEPLSADVTDTTTYLDVDLKTDRPLPELATMVLEFAKRVGGEAL